MNDDMFCTILLRDTSSENKILQTCRTVTFMIQRYQHSRSTCQSISILTFVPITRIHLLVHMSVFTISVPRYRMNRAIEYIYFS